MESNLCRHDSLFMHGYCFIWQLIGLTAGAPGLATLCDTTLLILFAHRILGATSRSVNTTAYLGLIGEHRDDALALIHI